MKNKKTLIIKTVKTKNLKKKHGAENGLEYSEILFEA